MAPSYNSIKIALTYSSDIYYLYTKFDINNWYQVIVS